MALKRHKRWFLVFCASWVQITIFHKHILFDQIKAHKIRHILVSKCYHKCSKFDAQQRQTMGQKFTSLNNSIFSSFCFIRNFVPSFGVVVSQISNIYDNTLRPKYDKSYVLLFHRIKYVYEKLWFALMRHKKPKTTCCALRE